MRYVSTRGRSPALGFAEVLLTGLAPDGGLYVPEQWPRLPPLEELSGLDYPELAARVMWPFVDDAPPGAGDEGAGDEGAGDEGAADTAAGLSRAVFDSIVADAYAGFDHPEVCPVRRVGDLWLMELFHGPTLAFKDVALQLVGRLFDEVLTERSGTVTILGATSGDTGSAAMAAFAGLGHTECVILFPEGRTSEVQRRQMTTIDEPNCHAVAVAGTFDDCQDLVKAAFADTGFRDEVHLSAVNSINWGRVMAQVVYYVWAHLRVSPDHSPVSFCVPTGNFGNVLAGWAAKRMGLPVDRLVVASNRNDILTRTFTTGDMTTREVVPTTSPSMDIQVSSNFERLLFEVLGRDGSAVEAILATFRSTGGVQVPSEILDRLRTEFDAGSLTDAEAARVMDRYHEDHDMLVDPHTAVGIGVAERHGGHDPTAPVRAGRATAGDGTRTPLVCLATAHPAKFPDAVFDATGVRPVLPDHLADIHDRPERVENVGNDLASVEALVRRVLAVRSG